MAGGCILWLVLTSPGSVPIPRRVRAVSGVGLRVSKMTKLVLRIARSNWMQSLGGRTLDWLDDAVVMVDQTRLPESFDIIRISTVPDLVAAIRRLSVRGAPAIGVAGAFGVALAARNCGDVESMEVRICWVVGSCTGSCSAGPSLRRSRRLSVIFVTNYGA